MIRSDLWPPERLGERWLVSDFRFDLDLGDALRPTFVVLVAETPRVAREPGASKVPLLWPERTDPGAIVSEVLAACVATRSG